ncbi:MAG: hypothetical protein ACKVWV_16460 [Planctomycetota bacterium]
MISAIVTLSLGTTASAQCNEWKVDIGTPGFETPPALVSAWLEALAEFDDGTGAKLVAAGDFRSAGGVAANCIARWDGAGWSSIGDLTMSATINEQIVRALTVFDAGGGPELYATGTFDLASGTPVNGIARFDGSAWFALGLGLDAEGETLASFDDGSGPALYAGGFFQHAGGVAAGGIARWNGASWSALGSGIPNVQPFGAGVLALCAFDDGSGPALYAGGSFTSIGGVAAANIARWNGSTWTAIGSGTNAAVTALEVFDEGTGPALYVGGGFTIAGGIQARQVARWNGASWSQVGSGISAALNTVQVNDFEVWNDGGASKLVMGGHFRFAFSTIENVAVWDGVSWTPLRTGVGGFVPPVSGVDGVQALKVHDDGHGSALYATGFFRYADGQLTRHIARYGPCAIGGTAYCFGDGSLATACPCAPPSIVPSPSGAADAGCANSLHLEGAKLVASGAPEALRLLASGLPTNAFGFFLCGDAKISAGIAAGDGVRCASGVLKRFGGQNASGEFSAYPNDRAGWSIPLSTISGVAIGSGARTHYQLYYRNAAANFCTSSTFNLSNAVAVIW